MQRFVEQGRKGSINSMHDIILWCFAWLPAASPTGVLDVYPFQQITYPVKPSTGLAHPCGKQRRKLC